MSPTPASALSPESTHVAEEAAAHYAAGSVREAESLLLNHLNATRGACGEPLWLMLLDLYQVETQRDAFEKLSLYYADYFKVSPPAWIAQTPVAKPIHTGRNALVIEGAIQNVHPEKIQDFLTAAREAGKARLDVSRARLPETREAIAESWRLLQRVMGRLRRYHVATLLMGEQQLVEHLRQQVAEWEGAVDQVEPGWLALLEFLQWRGQEEAFDQLAANYAERFEVSPPAYDPDGIVAVVPEDARPPAPATQNDRLAPPEQVNLADLPALEAAITEQLREHGWVRVDWTQVHRVSYEAASRLATFFVGLKVGQDRLVMHGPTQLLKVLFDMVGISALVQIEARRRR